MCTLAVWAGGSTTYYYRATAAVDESSTGAGKVYVTRNKSDNPTSTSINFSNSSSSTNVYLWAQGENNADLLGWYKNGTLVYDGTDNPYEASVSSTGESEDARVETVFTAKFGYRYISVSSEQPDLGTATIDQFENKPGDQVTITATPKTGGLGAVTFTGWSTTGNASDIFSTEAQLTIEVTEKVHYHAHFTQAEFKGGYYRFYNRTHKRYLWFVGTEFTTDVSWAGCSFNGSLECRKFEDTEDTHFSSPSNIINLTGSRNSSGGLNNTDLSAQGVSVESIKGRDQNFASMSIQTDYVENLGIYKFYVIAGWGRSRYLKDGRNYDNPYAVICGGDEENDFILEPVDEEHIDDYYFGPAPTATDGTNYYATMYTAFPYKCMDGVKAFIVTNLSDDGTPVLAEITEGLVPSNTPVLLQCNSTDPKGNRLVPQLAEPAITSVDLDKNVLVGKINLNDDAEQYQDLAFDSETMRVLSASEFKFVGNSASEIIECNTAYVDITKLPEVEPMTGTLAQIVAEGQPSQEVTVVEAEGDELVVVYQFDIDDEHTVLLAKDGGHYANPDVIAQDQYDFMAENGTINQAVYDQSNWVAIELPVAADIDHDYVSHKVTGVKGTLTNVANPTIKVTDAQALPVMGEQVEAYKPNTYIGPSFEGSQSSSLVERNYFFVMPKPQEYARLMWMEYYNEDESDDANARFITPSYEQNSKYNTANLVGEAWIDNSLNDDYANGKRYTHTNVYSDFNAIVQRTGNTSRKAATTGTASSYVVLPLSIPQGNVVTGVTTVAGERTAVSVQYVSLTGNVSSQPLQGVNIVVTTWSDGSRTSTKVVR